MKDIVNSYIAHVVIALAGFVTSVLAARLLLPIGRGELGQAMLWPNLLGALGACSIMDAIIFFTANRRERPEDVLGAAFGIGSLLSAALCATGLALVASLDSITSSEARHAAYLFLLNIPLSYFSTHMIALFMGQQQFGLWNLLRALPICANAFYIVLIVLTSGASVTGFVAAALLANATLIVIEVVLIRRRGVPRLRLRRDIVTGMFRYGFKLHLGDLLVLANQRLDQVLVVQWLKPEQYGYYLTTLSLATAASGLVTVLVGLVFPKASAEAERDKQFAVLSRYFRFAIILSALGSVLLFALADWLLGFVFGAAFAPAATALRILAIGIAPTAGKALLLQAVKVLETPWMIILAESVALVISGGLLLALVRSFGINGAAAALVAGQGAACLALMVILHWQVGSGFTKMLLPSSDDVRLLLSVLVRLRNHFQRAAP